MVKVLSVYRAWLKIKGLKRGYPSFKTRTFAYWEDRASAGRRTANDGLEEGDLLYAPEHLRPALRSFFPPTNRPAKAEVDHSSDDDDDDTITTSTSTGTKKRPALHENDGANLSRNKRRIEGEGKSKGKKKVIDDSWRSPPDRATAWSSFSASRATRIWDAHMCNALELRRSLDKARLATRTGMLALHASRELLGAPVGLSDAYLAKIWFSDGQDAWDCALKAAQRMAKESRKSTQS